MNEFFIKIRNLSSKIIKLFLKGEFSLGFYYISIRFPRWFFRFNKAIILDNKISSMKVPEHLNRSVKVEIATLKDVEDISKVSGWECDRIEILLNSGAICFLASLDDYPPAALTWLAFGTCYIKGMGYEYNLPNNSAYGVFSITLPEYRRKGLYLQMNNSIVEYANKHNIDTYVVLVEFTNAYSLNLRNQLGFIRKLEISYIKILFLKISIQKDLLTNKLSFNVFVSDPKKDITII